MQGTNLLNITIFSELIFFLICFLSDLFALLEFVCIYFNVNFTPIIMFICICIFGSPRSTVWELVTFHSHLASSCNYGKSH